MGAQWQGAGLAFKLDKETQILTASLEPDTQAAPIDEVWLKKTVAELGCGLLRFSPEAVGELLRCYTQAERITDLALAQKVNAQLALTISPDALDVTLDFVPTEDSPTLDESILLDALTSQGVTYGILTEAIKEAVTAGEIHGFVVAQGKPPVAGEDGELEYLVTESRNRAPKVDEFGHADYRDLGEIQVVHAGEPLMMRHPPQAGEDGITVRGDKISAEPGKEVNYAHDLPGAELAPGKPNQLVATISGQPVQVPNGMIVEPVFRIAAVNAASGHIRFDGSVVITGDVLAGMAVYATGDIEVGGVVEAATLDAGGDIVIKGGAMGGLGHNDGHYLRCGGSFHAGYVSQAIVEAGNHIFIDDSAIQCELSAIHSIRVGGKKSGHIVGGRAQASHSISAKIIGSPKLVVTRLEIGVNPVLNKQLQALIATREAKEKQLNDLCKVLTFALHHPKKMEAETLNKVRHTASSLSATIAEIRAEQEALERQIEISQHSKVMAEQAIFEGVEVVLGGLHYQVSENFGAGAIGLGKDGLALLPLSELTR